MDISWILNILISPYTFLLFLPLVGYFCYHNVYDYNDLADCVAAIEANKATIFITRQEAVTDDLTILATTAVKVIQGGGFLVSAGKTLTINGWLEAGAYQIFFGAGSVVLGAHASAASFPEWWTD